jgi:hypothetical protein
MESQLTALSTQLEQIAVEFQILNQVGFDYKLVETLINLCNNSTKMPVSCIQETEQTVKNLKQHIEDNLDLSVITKKQILEIFTKLEKLLESLLVIKIINEI